MILILTLLTIANDSQLQLEVRMILIINSTFVPLNRPVSGTDINRPLARTEA